VEDADAEDATIVPAVGALAAAGGGRIEFGFVCASTIAGSCTSDVRST
jgi:hypothetical protein